MIENLAGGYVNLAKFWSHVRKDSSCWIWTGRSTGGSSLKYGLFYVKVQSVRGAASRLETVHRISYELANGVIPAGLFVTHTCDIPLCVRPIHLRTGTHQDNMNDKVARNRQQKGTRVNTNRLTESEVREIRELRSSASWSYIRLGKHFKVTRQQARNICLRRQWKHVV